MQLFAQFVLSERSVNILPDSLRPKDRKQITFYEAAILLENFAFLDQKLASEFIELRNSIQHHIAKFTPVDKQILGNYGISIFDFQKGDEFSDTTLLRALKTIALIEHQPNKKFHKEEYVSRLMSTIVLSNHKQYEKALWQLERAEEIESKITDKDVVSGAYKSKAYIYNSLNLADTAIVLLKKADGISDKKSMLYQRKMKLKILRYRLTTKKNC